MSKCLLISGFVSDYVLKLWIEQIKYRNDNAMDILKVDIFGQNSEIFENFRKNDNFIEGSAPALRVIRAGTRLTVHRSLPMA